jgi:hypothetical protein
LLGAEQSSIKTSALYPDGLEDGVEIEASMVDEAANLEPEDLLKLAERYFAPAKSTRLGGRRRQSTYRAVSVAAFYTRRAAPSSVKRYKA